MKNTKELILCTALELFNSEGLSKVTLRTIANKMNISQGNLNYHYKKRDDIIETLYFRLVEKIGEKMGGNEQKTIDLASLFLLSVTIMEFFYEYRFFLLDFVQIMRENKIIRAHYLQLSAMREAQFLALFNALVAAEVLRKEVLPNEYLFLYKRFQILGDFWISSAEVTNKALNKKMIHEYSHIINQSIFPYLTDKGKEDYAKIVG